MNTEEKYSTLSAENEGSTGISGYLSEYSHPYDWARGEFITSHINKQMCNAVPA